MKRSLLVFALALTILISSGLPVVSSQAAAVDRLDMSVDGAPDTPVVLCLPGIYMNDPVDCAPAGPSAYLTQMAQKGITFPVPPVPVRSPDPALKQIDIRYGEVVTPNAPIYGSSEDALKGQKKLAVNHIRGEFTYISYSDMLEIDGKKLYMIDWNQWMTAADVSRIGIVPQFQGKEFSRTPNIPFGWVLTYFYSAAQVETQRTPGYQGAELTGHFLNLHDLVWVFDVQRVDDEDWYMVGPDEWVPQRVVARVIPNTTPPEGVTGDRWIEVNLFEQTLAVYDRRQLIFATLIATGSEPFYTRPGVFQIYEKHDTTPMSGSFEADGSDAYYLQDVPWTMYFDDARALHGAYWRAKLGFPQSHGCVNMTVGDSHWLYNWAQVGDWVYVWDPSGQTPTDPEFYKGGGY